MRKSRREKKGYRRGRRNRDRGRELERRQIENGERNRYVYACIKHSIIAFHCCNVSMRQWESSRFTF